MKLSKDLNLVLDRPQDDGSVIHVHSTPIALSTYNDNALLIGAAMMRVYGAKVTFQAAPRVLAPTLLQVAVETNGPETGREVYDRLLAEIHRRTLVLVAGAAGWDTVPFDEAVNRDLLDETDVSEVDGAALFFSAAWRFHGKADRRAVVAGAADLWSGSVTYLNSTEYVASLRTSTDPGTSGATDSRSSAGPGPAPQVLTETDADGVSRASPLPS